MAGRGFGRENFGDPMGGGGPISVVRAQAIAGRVVRVVFSEAPTFRSAAGQADALNTTNYAFSIDEGEATSPTATGVGEVLVEGPAIAVGNGAGASDERGVDVHVDRVLILGVTYRVTVSRVAAALGGALGAPLSAAFGGVARLLVVHPGERARDSIDVANTLQGSWTAGDDGDLRNQGSADGYRKRILRRATTPLDAFSHLRGYGTQVRLKELASLAMLASYQANLEAQIKREPETASVRVIAQLLAGQVLVVSIDARTKKGAIIQASVKVTADGATAF